MSDDMLIWLLVVEVVLLVAAGLFVVYYLGGRQKKEAHNAIKSLTKKIKKNSEERKGTVADDVAFSAMDEEQKKELLVEIQQTESKLYQHVAKLFLQKDVSDLALLDAHVNEISVPYLKAIKSAAVHSEAQNSNALEVSELNSQLSTVLDEKERLSQQLGAALKTLDEVSNEYANMFDGSKDKDELIKSKARMLGYYERGVADDLDVASNKKTSSPFGQMEDF
ncbi:MAG: hypothetical protein KBT50_00800 [Cycloclasticus sp.]|nr:hypothetical protein [Cycloclasticus sp.]MBQ0789129.1 hypothetical protein [Cycloclasticus sp.]